MSILYTDEVKFFFTFSDVSWGLWSSCQVVWLIVAGEDNFNSGGDTRLKCLIGMQHQHHIPCSKLNWIHNAKDTQVSSYCQVDNLGDARRKIYKRHTVPENLNFDLRS